MRRLRPILVWTGIALFAVGSFFMLQGLGIIPWPADSFMVGDQVWVMNGALLGVGGLVLILIARRIRG